MRAAGETTVRVTREGVVRGDEECGAKREASCPASSGL